MFSIGEFARVATVSVRALRHYDEIGLLKPAQVDPQTGYRAYEPAQLRQLNRIVALKELGLSLSQVKRLLAGITPDELRGMLMLRRAQLEQEIDSHSKQMLEVEARLRHIAKEGVMPADDITVKKIPAMGVVAIAAPAPAYGPRHIVPVVNHCRAQFDELGIAGLVEAAGPYLIFYEDNQGSDITVHVALPVARPPGELPAPAAYRVLPEVEAAVAVRSGRAATIFPMVYQDLVEWAGAHGYQSAGPGREVWVYEVDDIAEADQQVFEIQLPFTRPAPPAPGPVG